jgi:protein TonB
MDKAYFDAVLARLVPLQNHPSLAHLARRHASGLVLIAFTIGRDGTVLDAAVRRSSGYSFLDKAGLDLIRLASPMPALPETLDKETLAIEIPIRFTYP